MQKAVVLVLQALVNIPCALFSPTIILFQEPFGANKDSVAIVYGSLGINKIVLGSSEHLVLSFQVLSIIGKDKEPPYRCGADNGTGCSGTKGVP
jgi:hypothetical protein